MTQVDRSRLPRFARLAAIVALAGAVLLALSLHAPPAGASAKHRLKLKGTVTKETRFHGAPAAKVKVTKGSKKSGSMVVPEADCAGLECVQGGKTDLEVGKVKGKGKLHLEIDFNPNGSVKSATGAVSSSKASEKISVNARGVPQTPGSHFTFVLKY